MNQGRSADLSDESGDEAESVASGVDNAGAAVKAGVQPIDTDASGDVDWVAMMARLRGGARRRSSVVSARSKCPIMCKRCRRGRRGRGKKAADTRLRVKPSYLHFTFLFVRFALPLLGLVGFFAEMYATSVNAAKNASQFLDVAVAIEMLQADAESISSQVT